MSNYSGPYVGTLRLRVSVLAALLFASCGFGQVAAGKISSIESDTDRWIELQSQIAKSKNDWKSERLLLESSIEILEAEQATLEQAIGSNEQASKVYIANRDRIKELVQEHQTSLDALVDPLRKIESDLRAFLPRLPDPLRAEVESHLVKIDEQTAPVTSRAQSLVASLTAIDRFSNSLTSKRVARAGPNDGEVSVRVLYWGLAVAYGLDEANKRAWVIRPGDSGWDWKQQDEIYDAVLELINSYEIESENPRLIELPAALS